MLEFISNRLSNFTDLKNVNFKLLSSNFTDLSVGNKKKSEALTWHSYASEENRWTTYNSIYMMQNLCD